MQLYYWAALAAAALLFASCKNNAAADPRDGGTTDADTDSNPSTVLKKNLDIDLSEVVSLIVTSNAATKGPPSAAMDAGVGCDTPLFALTESGDLIAVALVDCHGAGAVHPSPRRIFPFPTWIFFSMGDGFTLDVPVEDGGTALVECETIAAHRDTGKLFCAPLSIRLEMSGEQVNPGGEGVFVNAAGELGYLVALDSAGQRILYRLALDPEGGPVATLVDTAMHPAMETIDAEGDLFAWIPGSMGGDPASLILPAGGGEVVFGAGYSSYAVTGKTGEADENTFYRKYTTAELESGISVMREGDGGVFEEVVVPVDGEPQVDAGLTGSCAELYRLADGIYTRCFPTTGIGFARVVVDGEVIGSPTMDFVHEVDELIAGCGSNPCRAEVSVIFVADYGGAHKFVRYDGAGQQDVPLDTDINIMGMSVSRAGDINFTGVLISTNEKIVGVVAAGSTVVTILSSEAINADDVVSFTPIN